MADIHLHHSAEEAQSGATTQNTCSCGERNEGVPEVDVQTIPHAVRHAAIFGMIDALASGSSLILAASHNPIPLLQQLEQRSPGLYETRYLEEGPERWRLLIQRG
ncbi:MAG: DUF2249 domain-containing protein [Microbacteriaceae bacterium]